jgi:hypothetical protein
MFFDPFTGLPTPDYDAIFAGEEEPRTAGGPPVDPRTGGAVGYHADPRFALGQAGGVMSQPPAYAPPAPPAPAYQAQRLYRNIAPSALNSFGVTPQNVPGIHSGANRRII